MDSDLIELVSTARTLERAAKAAPKDWPPAARAVMELCLVLSENASAVLRMVKDQDALIATLRGRVDHLESHLAILRGAIRNEGTN